MEERFLYRTLKTIASGDRKAFRELFYLYKDQVYAYAMHFTRSPTTAEEVVQEIFLKLWLHHSNLSEIENFEGYLHTITRNCCFDHLKKAANEQHLKQQLKNKVKSSEESVESTFLCNHYDSLVRQALELLPPQQQKIYTLSFYQGKKQEEIAGYLKISRNTVKVHLSKARASIRQYLAARIDLGCVPLFIIFSYFFML